LLHQCRDQTEVFSTHRYRPKKAHEISDRDADLMGTIQERATSITAFCDKYRSGFTLVTYGDAGYKTWVKTLLETEEKEMDTIYARLLKKEVSASDSNSLVKLPNVDKLALFPSMLECWLTDLSPCDRRTYLSYCNGEPADLKDLLYLDTGAARELRFRGFLPPVKGAPASEAAPLTGDAHESLESRGDAATLPLFPGLWRF
jgi:hypothetical protein